MIHIVRSRRRIIMLGIDLAVFCIAYYISFLLRLDSPFLGAYAGIFWQTLPFAVVSQFLGMYISKVYRGIWRYASVNDLLNIIKGEIGGTAGIIAVIVFIRGTPGFPRSVFLINAVLVVMGIGGVRFLRRLQVEMFISKKSFSHGKPVIIVGGGDAADDLIRELRHNPRIKYRPVGIVDDAPVKMSQELHGVKVIGTINDLPRLAREKGVEEIIIAIPSAIGAQMRRIVELCQESGLPYKTMPGTGDILNGKVQVRHLRKVQVEDLLRREPVWLDRKSIASYIGGKKVLVTGAGGSIGSELCRQSARFGPAELILLDHSENSLFHMDEEFKRILPGLKYRMIVADVTRPNRMKYIMNLARPEVVFHAAAHKHVPLMENCPQAALQNNVTGTRVVAEAALEAGCGKFIMISTDKAVNPSSIMGVSKRIAEILVQEMNRIGNGRTEFVSVRFGNVMGSMGSVVPLFKTQIESGGPITVTDPEVVRYFMTIPESVQLVLQAAAMGRGGEIFILDMGEPIKIVDLARDMITLSGLEPEVDISIEYTGLRPGEKLYEELITEGEGIVPTEHSKIMVLRPNGNNNKDNMLEKIMILEKLVAKSSGMREMMAHVRNLVPEYKHVQKY